MSWCRWFGPVDDHITWVWDDLSDLIRSLMRKESLFTCILTLVTQPLCLQSTVSGTSEAVVHERSDGALWRSVGGVSVAKDWRISSGVCEEVDQGQKSRVIQFLMPLKLVHNHILYIWWHVYVCVFQRLQLCFSCAYNYSESRTFNQLHTPDNTIPIKTEVI